VLEAIVTRLDAIERRLALVEARQAVAPTNALAPPVDKREREAARKRAYREKRKGKA
jgi:hypothetical protein